MTHYRRRTSPSRPVKFPVAPAMARRGLRVLTGMLKGLLAFFLTSLLLLLIFVLFHQPLLRSAARAWVIDETELLDPPIQSTELLDHAAIIGLRFPADAIVVLTGSLASRPLAAAQLYREGHAPKVLLLDIPAREELATPGEDYVSGTLMQAGVPAGAIVIRRTNVSSTVEEARSMLEWCRETGAKRLIVVTDQFHTRRTRWILDRVLEGEGIQARIVASQPTEYELDAWWKTEFGLVEFNNEIMKYLFYRWNY